MALWTPADMTTSLWLDAADAATITEVSGKVSQWNDKSGNSRHVSQSTAAQRPTAVASVLNSKAIVRFNITNGMLSTPSSETLSGGGNISVFAICNQTGATSISNSSVIAQEGGVILKTEQYSTFRPRFQPYVDGLFRTAEGSAQVSGWNQLEGVKNDTGGVLYVNGTQDGTYSYTGDIEVPSAIVRIGKAWLDNTEFVGDVAEIVVVAGEVTTDERLTLEGYLAYKWGLQYLLPAGHPYKINPPFTGGVLGVLRQHYDLEPRTHLAVLKQIYDIQYAILSVLEQPYAFYMMAILEQQYGDYERVVGVLEQYYGDMDPLIAVLVQEYGDLAPIMAILEQPYALRGRLMAQLVQTWNIVGRIQPSVLKQVWDMLERNQLTGVLQQPYSLFPDTTAVDAPTAWVTIDGIRIHVTSIDYDYNIDSYCGAFRMTLSEDNQWATVQDRQSVITHINGVDHHAVVVSKSDSKTHRQTVLSVEARSPAVLLDFPFASAVEETFVVTGTASQICSDLAALEGLTITWHMDSDPPLTDEDVLVYGDSPLGGIRNIVNELGGRVNSWPDGSIHAVKRHPVDSDKYDAATPVYEMTTGLDYIVLNTNTDKRSGFNKFELSSDRTSSDYKLKSESVSTGRIDVRATKIPWSSANVELHTSDLSSVTILPKGIQNVTVTEEIEITGGTGQVEEPCYGAVTADYTGRTDLGAATITEDGKVTTTVEGDSIVSLTYPTRHWLWETSDTASEKVQFILVKP